VIRLSGLVPGEDIEIKYTGIRPGEKLFEELATGEESADKTKHPKILVGKLRPYDWPRVENGLKELALLTNHGDREAIKNAFARLVPEYSTSPREREGASRAEERRSEARITLN
jgi:FlaA1/EpsC-like NDP-sugar epimerase